MKKELGKKGENIAAGYLSKQGYKILQRNYYTRYGEVDIICAKDDKLVFVEVKTRRSTKFGYPEEAVTARKIDHLRHAALIYMNEQKHHYREIRFDVISILIDKESNSLNHIQQAF